MGNWQLSQISSYVQSKPRFEMSEELHRQWESEQASLKLRLVDSDTEAWQRSPSFSGLQRVGGVDLSFIKGDDVNACAQLVVLSYPEMELLYEDCRMVTLSAPYVAGFLAFRETPFLVEAVQRLESETPSLLPQVIFVDGNGLFHYREFGLACHLGVLTGLPCIGVAKNLLQVQGVENSERHKEQIKELRNRGDTFPLEASSGRVLGKALKSSDRSTKPLYVSVGHRISLDTALRLTTACCKYRIPEPIRQADIRSREYLRKHFPEGSEEGATAGRERERDGLQGSGASNGIKKNCSL
ncbi:endonuclease V-like isoform X2 [Acipenser ruthenus]|uniref:endonuclease V-like isoform X2 n=1 Tax=Acipenser ruthenus TaxID=7906 RepID=UPI00145B7F05|nr:endonuclease V-like isoform X2 [Acipenser ruthenus]